MRLLLLAIALAVAPAPARADDGYWAELAAVDGASVGIATAGVLLHPERSQAAVALAGVGIAGLLFGSPLVHLHHGHSSRALASLALRQGLPAIAIAAMVSRARWECREDPGAECSDDNTPLIVIGVAYAIGAAIDYALIRPDEGAAPGTRMLTLGGAF